MRWRLSLRSRAAVLSLIAVASGVWWWSIASAQEMHEFFSNTRQSPASVDYGAAYYEHREKTGEAMSSGAIYPLLQPALPQPTIARQVDNDAARRSYSNQAYGRRSSLAGTGPGYSVTSWLGRRPDGVAFLGVRLDRTRGAEAMVSRVDPDSPAAQSGLRTGDVIRSVNGQRISSPDELPRQISRLQPGERVQLAIDRP